MNEKKGFMVGRNYIKTSKEGKKYYKGKHFGIPTYGVRITDSEHINKFTNEPEMFISMGIDFSPNAKGEAFTVDMAIAALENEIIKLKEYKNGSNSKNQGQNRQISGKSEEKTSQTTKQTTKEDIQSISDNF